MCTRAFSFTFCFDFYEPYFFNLICIFGARLQGQDLISIIIFCVLFYHTTTSSGAGLRGRDRPGGGGRHRQRRAAVRDAAALARHHEGERADGAHLLRAGVDAGPSGARGDAAAAAAHGHSGEQ